MARVMARIALGFALVATGWIAARAQSPEPDLVIAVDAPGGQTVVRCVRGCRLAWVERGVNPNSVPVASFGFGCTGAQCPSLARWAAGSFDSATLLR
jgi:hypothetical protein